MKKEYFNLYANCIIVEGYAESIIIDFQAGHIYNIPNLLCEILNKLRYLKINEVKRLFNNEYNAGIDSYIDKLIEMEVGFFLDDPKDFPDISVDWDSPSKIQTAILELDGNKPYNYMNVIEQLCLLGCNVIQLRIVNFCNNKLLRDICDAVKYSRIKYIEYFFDSSIFDAAFAEFFFESSRIMRMIIYNCSNKQWDFLRKDSRFKEWQLIFTENKISTSSVDIINSKNFWTNIDLYSEAQSYNPALNRKVSIDSSGNVKNYLSHMKVFGNIMKNNIEEIVSTEDFQKKWYINNDKIETCKDCQFRYLCFSNSDIIEKDGSLFKIDLCTFDPFTNIWSD